MPERCIACEGTSTVPVLRVQDHDIVRCTTCGRHALDPMPTTVEMDTFDAGSGYAPADLREAILAEHARTLTALEAFTCSGRLLDAGCGTGLFLEAAAARGWNAVGVDPARAAMVAASARGLRVIHGHLDDPSLQEGSFDAVTALQVVEHLPDPRVFLARCARLLRPGGVLLVATPNPLSWLARATRENFSYWIPPTHVAWYPPPALRRLVSGAGLRPVRTRTWTTGALHEGMTIASALPVVRALPYRVRAAAGDVIARLADARGAGTIVEQYAVKP